MQIQATVVKQIIRVSVVALVLCGCTVFDAAAQNADPTLLTRMKEYEAAWKAMDAAKLATFFAPDALSFCEGCPLNKGREAIRRSYESMFKQGLTELTASNIETNSSGDIAVDVGRFSFPSRGPEKGRTGIYLRIWKRLDGQWLVAYDTFSTEGQPKPK
jgi:uncharacterized protein (TIGR02246 family)